MTKDEEKVKELNDFFASVFNSKASSSLNSQSSELKDKLREAECNLLLPSYNQEKNGKKPATLIQKSMGSGGIDISLEELGEELTKFSSIICKWP